MRLLICLFMIIPAISEGKPPYSFKEVQTTILKRSEDRIKRLDNKEDKDSLAEELAFNACVKVAKTVHRISECAEDRLFRIEGLKAKIAKEEKMQIAREIFYNHKKRALRMAKSINSSPEHISCLKNSEVFLELQKCLEKDLKASEKRLKDMEQ